MLQPAYLPLKANRFTDFAATLVFTGRPMVGRAYRVQVRRERNTLGEPFIDLQMKDSSTVTGLRVAQFLPNGGRLAIYISAEDVAKIAGDAKDDFYAVWDLVEHDTQNNTDVLASGPFIIRAGVTNV